MAVVNPEGKVMVSSLPDSLEDRIGTLVRLDKGLKTVQFHANLQYDVVNEPVTVSTGTWHVIEARNSESGQAVLNGLTLVLVIGVVLLVIGFGVSTWLVSGLALAAGHADARTGEPAFAFVDRRHPARRSGSR